MSIISVRFAPYKGGEVPMRPQEVLDLFRKAEAIITDSHIVYTSGKHGSAYVNKDVIYAHPNKVWRLCQEMAESFIRLEAFADVVIAPAIGGVVLSHATALHLGHLRHQRVMSAFAEKLEGGDIFVIGRGYDKFVKGKKVFVVEDVLNTGGSAKKVIKAVSQIGGHVVGLGALCNRGGVTRLDLGLTEDQVFFSLVTVKMDAHDEADCPLCAAKVPINEVVGKGREFLARRKAKR